MQLYLDTSALMKLVIEEPESPALTNYLGEHPVDTRFTAALARTELVRAVSQHQSIDSIAHARRVVGRLNLVPLTTRLLDTAATMLPPGLRTLDSIHMAAAMTVPDLRAVVTYDDRLSDAATDAGLVVVSPS